ncbi:MAG: Hsp20/alpha crystallin family protein [Phycisphaerae bacterium]
MAEEQKIDVERKPAAAQAAEADEEVIAPLVDVWMNAEGTVTLAADVSGASPESVDVRVDRGVLTIEAEGKVEHPGGDYSALYTGFGGGRYYRAFALSDEVDRDAIEASLSDGVLTVRMPRAKAAETKKIPIKEG